MHRLGICFSFCLGIAALGICDSGDSDFAHYKKFEFGKKWFHSIQADTNRDEITPTAYYSRRLTNFWSIAGKAQPVAAITGTFFAWENQQPVADVVIDGEQKAKGLRGSVLAVDWRGKPVIFDVPTNKKTDYSNYRYALRGMIRVVSAGEVNPDPQSQGFKDKRIWGKAARTAIGLTKEGKLMMVATTSSVTLSHLGKAMKSVGVVDGVALDGGGSTMLYYMGDVKVSPNRGLSTVFMVEKRSCYDQLFKQRWEAGKIGALLSGQETRW